MNQGNPLPDLPPNDELTLRIELAANTALENLREARRRQWLRLVSISSALVIVVSSIAGFLINELLDFRVRDRVEETIDLELADTRFSMEIARVNLSSTELNTKLNGDGVAKEDFERMRNELKSVVQTYLRDPHVRPKTQQERERHVVPVLASLIDVSASAGADQYVDEFYNLAPEILKNSDSVTQTMVQHAGRKLIGNAGAPGTWRNDNGESTDEYRLYKTFAGRARATGYPELFLAFELVVRHMERVPRAEIEDLINDAKTLNETDKQQFIYLMKAHSGGEFAQMRSASVVRIINRFLAFLNEYKDLMKWIDE